MKKEADKVRIDKWMWAVRLYKTRSLATHACEQGKISVNNTAAKASRIVKEGDVIQIKRTGILRTYKIVQVISNRIAAKLVEEHCQDLTPADELEAYKSRSKRSGIYRDPGTGRPTKRERRDLDDFLEDN
jgi:ribosome-associated heat shock protein Hsp15